MFKREPDIVGTNASCDRHKGLRTFLYCGSYVLMPEIGWTKGGVGELRARAGRRSIVRRVSGAMFDPVKREGWPRPEPPKPERKLDTMPIDWQGRIDEAIESERATTFEIVVHAIADVTA